MIEGERILDSLAVKTFYGLAYIYIRIPLKQTWNERETDRQTDRDTERDRQTDRDRQTETDRQTEPEVRVELR